MHRYMVVLAIIVVAYAVTFFQEKKTDERFQQLLAKEGRVVAFDEAVQAYDVDVSKEEVLQELPSEKYEEHVQTVSINFPFDVLGMITNDARADSFIAELEQLTIGALENFEESTQRFAMSGHQISVLLGQRREMVNDAPFRSTLYAEDGNKMVGSFARKIIQIAR